MTTLLAALTEQGRTADGNNRSRHSFTKGLKQPAASAHE